MAMHTPTASSISSTRRLVVHNPDPESPESPDSDPQLVTRPSKFLRPQKVLYTPPPRYEGRLPIITKQSPTTSGSTSRNISPASTSPQMTNPKVLAPDGTSDIAAALRTALESKVPNNVGGLQEHTVNLSNLIVEIVETVLEKLGVWLQLVTDLQGLFNSQDFLEVYQVVDDSLRDLARHLSERPLRALDVLDTKDESHEWLIRHNERLTKLTKILMKWNIRLAREVTLCELEKVTKVVASYAPSIIQYSHSIQGSLQVLQARRFKAAAMKPLSRRFGAPPLNGFGSI